MQDFQRYFERKRYQEEQLRHQAELVNSQNRLLREQENRNREEAAFRERQLQQERDYQEQLRIERQEKEMRDRIAQLELTLAQTTDPEQRSNIQELLEKARQEQRFYFEQKAQREQAARQQAALDRQIARRQTIRQRIITTIVLVVILVVSSIVLFLAWGAYLSWSQNKSDSSRWKPSSSMTRTSRSSNLSSSTSSAEEKQQSSQANLSAADFFKTGGMTYQGYDYQPYNTNRTTVKAQNAGHHFADRGDGIIIDEDGYIVIYYDKANIGDVLDTPFGLGKVYKKDGSQNTNGAIYVQYMGNYGQTTSQTTNTTQLTKEQVKKWVQATYSRDHNLNPDTFPYKVEVFKGNDGLAYARVIGAEESVGYRVSQDGYLEQRYERPNADGDTLVTWVLVAEDYFEK